jgi:hypothetical protein
VCDVRKRTAVHERGHAFGRLHEVRFHCIAQQGGHRADAADGAGRHGCAVRGVADDDAGEPRFQVGDAVGETQHRHHFARRGDVEAGLAGHAFGAAAETRDDCAQGPVVHVHDALPRHAAGIEPGRIAVMQAVVDQRREQVVRTADGVEVAVEVHVDVHGGQHFRGTAAGTAALHAEDRSEARFAQGRRAAHADLRESLRETDGGRGLAFAGGCRRDRGDEDQPAAARPVPIGGRQ